MDDFLGIYLRDQLAMGVAWRELAKRSARNNRDTELGEAMTGVATAIAEDVATFQSIMRRLGVQPNPVKTGLALVAERVGRLKMNGRLRTYSPLSRFTELEFLAMGIDGKKQLWTTLRDLADLNTRLPDVDFDELIARAEHQRAVVEPFRVHAGTEALAAGSSGRTDHPAEPAEGGREPGEESASPGRTPHSTQPAEGDREQGEEAEAAVRSTK